ncbi:MAG: S41 family peptidase [Gammaproteobacteria bacterium]|nr:S41 family peptidase [Gammaproteobacteria bacterium]MDH5800613.1 S41 family peptidase [Gammaproteobacteria bacterium]
MPVNPRIDPYVLQGRLVTMSPQGIVEDGAVYINQGIIEAVKPISARAPAGYKNADRIKTGDTLYPGLIELHNHLAYNAMPLWDVPQKYTNNSQWRGSEDYRRQITKPTQVLGATQGVVEALVRYVEMRALLGGVTTTQGISLSSEPGIKRYYKGLVRNVEQPLDSTWPAAGTNIGNPVSGQAEQYLQKLYKKKCYLQHLSEGVDDTARNWFLRLQKDNGQWAINEAFCGIHSTALHAADYQVIADHGGSMVWSPLSNYLLYGATASLGAVKQAGLKVALGSDWAPSGSKNLLGELKVAWLASEQQGSVFSPQELVAMVTSNPAHIVQWHQHLGSIEPGLRADIIAVNGQCGGSGSDEDYLRLIKARETSITLVVIDGVPRLGQPRLMDVFGPGSDSITIGRSKRMLNLKQDDADPLVGALSLSQATQRLQQAMANLPRLAQDLNAAQAANLFSGSVDHTGAKWRIDMDFQEDDAELEVRLHLATQPLSYYVTDPMQLEPITVVDDEAHLRKLMGARNLPDFIKTGLPPLYGKRLSPTAEVMEKSTQPLAPQVLQSTRELAPFLRLSGELTLADRKRIVQQAMIVIGENYVHLPLKRAMHAVDPLQRLRLLKYQLDETYEAEMPPELDFHHELSHIFNSLRDLHTGYRLPRPFAGHTAWLPFLVEEIWENGQDKYIVSFIVTDLVPEGFQKGVSITHWNGVPIKAAIQDNANRHAGSNKAARWARGINSLTLRPLASGLPPLEEWVNITYRDLKGQAQEWKQDWLMFQAGAAAGATPFGVLRKEAAALGNDDQTDAVQQAKKVLFVPHVSQVEADGLSDPTQVEKLVRSDAEISSLLPAIFRARKIKHSGMEYAYIRIFTFNTKSADEFVQEFVRLSGLLPDSGLVIDVRGNGGGLIYAAEQLLQVLTPRTIEPERAQFINSPLNLALCRNHAKSEIFPGLELQPWVRSMKQSVQTGATFSLGYPITPEHKCNEIGQQYFGPVVLIVDPLCYSATDIFAAGFKDHKIGPVLGTGTNTGAGGANVWTHQLLSRLMQPHQSPDVTSPYQALPKGSDIRVAIRRTMRVGDQEGDIIEDLGIEPDAVHRMTRRDVLQSNEDLIAAAIDLIAESKQYSLDVQLQARDDRLPVLQIVSSNIDRIDATIGDVQLHSVYPQNGQSNIDLQDEVVLRNADQVNMELRGYSANHLVVKHKAKFHINTH